MNSDGVLALFGAIADDVASCLAALGDRHLYGERDGQYALDLVADPLVVAPLVAAGFGVLSEESGRSGDGEEIVVVADPVDGSTNASLGLPFYATSLCALDGEGPWVGLVQNLATGTRYWAVRGEGAFRDGEAINVSSKRRLSESVVCLNGIRDGIGGWEQCRAFGAAALELCFVAEGSVDAYLNCAPDTHGSWDYLAGGLIVSEAGGVIVDAEDRDLLTVDHAARRTPFAACSVEVLAEGRSMVAGSSA